MKAVIRFLIQFLFIFVLLGILFSFAMFQGGVVSWFLFFGFLPIFVYLAGLLLYPITGWEVSRQSAGSTFYAGDHVEAKLIISRKFPFPIAYCIVEEKFPQSLQRMDKQKEKYVHMAQPEQLYSHRRMKKVVFPWFKRVIKIPYTIEHVPRGNHQLQTIRIRTGDIFGFVKKEHHYQAAASFMVFPRMRRLDLTEQLSSDGQGTAASRKLYWKNTNAVSGVREYVPGDKVTAIDWKQTARTNVMMTKEFEQEKGTDKQIVLDNCYTAGMNIIAYEAAIELTVSLQEAIRGAGAQAGLYIAGEKIVHFPPEQQLSEGQAHRRYLAEMKPENTNSFAVQLKKAGSHLGNGATVMVVTSHLDEAVRKSLNEIKQRAKQLIVFFIQPQTMISGEDRKNLEALQAKGIRICVLTEKQLAKDPIEVKLT